jgi:RHS repeat-associated protein
MNNVNGSPIGLKNMPRRSWTYSRDARGLIVQARSRGGWVLLVKRDQLFRWQEIRDSISLIAHREFDEFGYETELRDAEGKVSRTRYDDLHRPIEVTLGSSDVTRYGWNAVGHKTECTGPGSQRDTWQYDPYGHLVAHTNALGHTMRWEYDKEGNVTAIINRVGERLEYRRDAVGRIVEEKLFDGRIQRYEYDLAGRQVKIHLSDGRTVSQTFDPAGRLLCRKSSDGLVEEFAYDKEGREVKAWNNHAVVELERDRSGRITAEIQNGRRVEYRYDNDGNRIARWLSSAAVGGKLWRFVDARGRLIALLDDRGICQELRWDSLNRQVERRGQGGIVERFTYDSEGRVHEHRVIAGGNQSVRSYTYDSSGNIATFQDERKGMVHYTYDPLDRLREARKDGSLVEAYDYDGNNGIRATHRGSRLSAAGGKTVRDGVRELAYGEDGALMAIRMGPSAQSLKHDVNGRLVKVIQPDGTIIRYEYDPFGRRTAKTVGEDRTEFLWEVWELAAELRDGQVQNVFISEDLRPLAQWKDGRHLTPILDYRGAVREVFSEFSQLRWSCTLDAYGNLLTEAGDCPSPFRLRGQYHDTETGLHHNYHRHYDPRLGDYTAPDPIGIAGGCHFYAYPRNPLRWDDPYGLICNDPTKHPDGEDPSTSTNPRAPKQGEEGGPEPVSWTDDSFKHATDRHDPRGPRVPGPEKDGKPGKPGTPYPEAWSNDEFRAATQDVANDPSVPRVPVPPERGGVGWTKEAPVTINGETRNVRVIGEVPDPAIPTTGPGVITSAYPTSNKPPKPK